MNYTLSVTPPNTRWGFCDIPKLLASTTHTGAWVRMSLARRDRGEPVTEIAPSCVVHHSTISRLTAWVAR